MLHGAFQTGHKAAGWNVNQMLRGLYGLLKDIIYSDYIRKTFGLYTTDSITEIPKEILSSPMACEC